MILGIDLGTTHSLIAAWRNGQPQLIPNALGEYLTPSVVSVSDEGTILVGRAAHERLITHPGRSAAAFKRFLGTDRLFHLGDRSFRAEQLSALVLGALRADAEAFLGEPVTEAVISVPAYFNDTQRKATRLAGEFAGLKVERLINEPTAAALAYGLHQAAEEAQFLVFDLGGGTFDVSILELFDGVMEVHASAGDNFLGGEDFVDVIVAMFLEASALKATKLSAHETARLRAAGERAKRQLNTEDQAVLEVRFKHKTLTHTIERIAYERRIEPLLERIRVPIERALRDANLRLRELDEIVLVGGSTRKIVIQKLAAQSFGQLPLRHINPDEVVALGAAVQAGLKMHDAALSEVVMTDVCPYTLGIKVTRKEQKGPDQDGIFSPIIERNTVIPASRSDIFSPLYEGQRQLAINVYQGESRRTNENLFLGKLALKLPKLPQSEAGVEVRFTYDVNGLLEVDATILHTGQTHHLLIEQRAGSMSEKEIARRLKTLQKLKIHPRDQLENQTLLNRANRVFEESLKERRTLVSEVIDHFESALSTQDPRTIQKARISLETVLDTLEFEPQLPR